MLVAICTLAFFYCLGISWLLQVVVYPTYRLVGKAEFVPFHVAQGRRMIPVLMIPRTATALLAMISAVLHRNTPHSALLQGAAACAAVVVAITLISEVPKHLALDKNGKDDKLLDGLVRANLPRSLAWTVGYLLLVLAQR